MEAEKKTRKITREELEAHEREAADRERRRRERERLYQLLFDHAGTAVCLVEGDGVLAKVNQKFAGLLGVPPEEIEGHLNLDALMGDEVLDLFREAKRRAERNEPDEDLMGREFPFRRPDGDERLVEITFAIFPDSERATAAIWDVTEKRALERAIVVKDQYLTSLLRDSHDAIIGVDLDGTIRSWNRGAWAIFGFEPEEIIGQSYRMVMPPELDEEAEFDKITTDIQQRGFLNERECTRLTKDGRRILLSATRTAVKDASGQVIGFSSLMRDITERKRMEQRLIQSERLSALGEMAAFLAHEIKNPLNSMVINLEVMKGLVASIPADQREKMETKITVLSREIHRLDKVIRNMLDLARPVKTDAFKKTDLNEVVGGLVELMDPQAQRKGARIESSLGKDVPQIVGGTEEIKQAVINVMLNGLQAMVGEGGTLRVSTEAADGDTPGARVKISDEGPGIPPEVAQRLFDPFFTTKADGNGMGLSIVQRIVDGHGGNVQIETELGKGTTFTLFFPAA